MKLLAHLFTRFVQRGELTVIDWSGRRHVFRGMNAGPAATIALHHRSLGWRLLVNPELYAAEAYMDGVLTLEEGTTLDDFLTLYWHNNANLAAIATQRLIRLLWMLHRRYQQLNTVRRARKNVQAHYDLTREFYELFLDDGLNYSCGYFRRPDDTLEQAQSAKILHAISKLDLKPGMKVLEIGGGWGMFAIALARVGVEVVSLNVSTEQLAVANDRARAAGLRDRVRFVLKDYREFDEGEFDRVVSVGMMEHVGAPFLPSYFEAVRKFLKPEGFAFIHSIGRTDPPGTTSPFLRKYIFPGGYVPALSETLAAVEYCGLWCADIEVLRLHYHYTIRHWQTRFAANRLTVKRMFDERFCRMWEFYLAVVGTGFLHGPHMVFQLLVSRERDAVPITRDFMMDAERRLGSAFKRLRSA